MTDDTRGSAEAQWLACLREGGAIQLPGAEGMAAGVAVEVGHRAPCSPVEAASRVIASGIFERIAQDMIHIDRGIKAAATPRLPFADVLAKSNAKFVSMKGWGL